MEVSCGKGVECIALTSNDDDINDNDDDKAFTFPKQPSASWLDPCEPGP